MTIVLDKGAMGVGDKAAAIALNGGKSVMATVRGRELDDIQAWQITTPEGLIAFFSERMLETNRDLRSLLEGQGRRNDTVKTLNEMQRIMNGVKTGEILAPGHPNWAEFHDLLEDVRGRLPDGALADEITATLERAAARQTPYQDDWAKKSDADLVASQCFPPTVAVELPNGKWRVASPNGPPAGINQEQGKDLATKLKNVAENMQGANQMDSVRVQELVSRVSQIMSTVSNIIHKFDEGKMAAINNIR